MKRETFFITRLDYLIEKTFFDLKFLLSNREKI